ncbi:nitroreductase family deazaflavin-dependent oxidoreductase [Monashia sp. NPDC004114]
MSGWNDHVISEFRENSGKVGGYFEGAPMILIHHIGARTGTVRVSPLVYFPEDDGAMLIVASKGGAPTSPDWYHNVKAHPRFDVEVGTETFTVEATELAGAERTEQWERIVAERPGFGDYQKKTTRTLPVLRLRRAA